MNLMWPVLCVVLIYSHSQHECECLHDDTSLIERPGRNLCANETKYKDVDCSNQVNRDSPVRCRMRYINKTSKECAESEFTGRTDSTETYGTVQLKPFAWFESGFLFPSLNITFTQIRWEKLKMRFIKVGSSQPELCREFSLQGEVTPTTQLSFDCLWGNGTLGGEHYRFQYMMKTGQGHRFLGTYLLQIPKDTDVDEGVTAENYHLFIIMDKTTLPVISLKLQVPPKRLKISRASVFLFYQEGLDKPVENLKDWSSDLSDKLEGEFVKVGEVDTTNTPGYYYFNATFKNSQCNNLCPIASTPQLHIEGWRYGVQASVIVIIFSVAILALVVFMLWRKKYNTLLYEGEKQVNVLLVMEHSFPSHINNVYKFKQFLEDNSYVQPKLDLLDIPKCDSMNPMPWYHKAFQEAHYVLVFASPTPGTVEPGDHEDNVYPGLYARAKNLLQYNMENGSRFKTALVRLPGCSWDTLPLEACGKKWKKFALPEELSSLFKFLGVPPLVNGGSLMVSALQQPRAAPSISVAPPSAPQDQDSIGLADLAREPLTTPSGHTFNLDGVSYTSSSAGEEEDEVEESEELAGFRF